MTSEVAKLPEIVQGDIFRAQLARGDYAPAANAVSLTQPLKSLSEAMVQQPALFTAAKIRTSLDAAFATFLLHVESRVASLCGCGFYTIGPCGEEQLSPLGTVLRATDPTALHYRHIAVTISRHLESGVPMESILLDRARAFVVSSSDPVTGGAHCAIGGTPADFLVTSTLASQACPALGRALGLSLAPVIGVVPKFPADAVSFVSVGDGSVHNAHFLSAINVAEYASFRGFRSACVFCVSDNGVSISLRGQSYLTKGFLPRLKMPVFAAYGRDAVDVMSKSSEALSYARQMRKPCVLLLGGLTRRFGHAATDRQAAYLSKDEIASWAATNPLLDLSKEVVNAGLMTSAEVHARFVALEASVKAAFEAAIQEPKITAREEIQSRTSAKLIPLPAASVLFPIPAQDTAAAAPHGGTSAASSSKKKGNARPAVVEDAALPPRVEVAQKGILGPTARVMRVNMNGVFAEALATNPKVVYIGEDVTHGGYYIVTDGLQTKFPYRVADFPPDETALIGIGMGYSQVGLLPIVEIPYAKYLDCGYDMFAEACIMNWLSKGKQPNGMVIRLQGFGRGVFGGNFHTHNHLSIPPGIDVVSYSNGADYVRAMRYALHQASAGRLVMFVDCTELLNVRAIPGGHPAAEWSWEFPFPAANEMRDFQSVKLYHGDTQRKKLAKSAVVTYGGGVLAALEAQASRKVGDDTFDVIDSPLLSEVSIGLDESVRLYDKVVFADICKRGPGSPLASHFATLHGRGALPHHGDARHVKIIGAEPTYNPLGNTLTFTNAQDIIIALSAS